jgi:hypothetical protein
MISKLVSIFLLAVCAGLVVVACDSGGGYSVHTSYRVGYDRGYGIPRHYPRGGFGPPIIYRPRPPGMRPPGMRPPGRPHIQPIARPRPMRRR